MNISSIDRRAAILDYLARARTKLLSVLGWEGEQFCKLIDLRIFDAIGTRKEKHFRCKIVVNNKNL